MTMEREVRTTTKIRLDEVELKALIIEHMKAVHNLHVEVNDIDFDFDRQAFATIHLEQVEKS